MVISCIVFEIKRDIDRKSRFYTLSGTLGKTVANIATERELSGQVV